MKHIGQILKQHIEAHHLKKGDVAKRANISYNYLSTIFKQESCDAALLERLYVAAGLNPALVFDIPEQPGESFSDIAASTFLGDASVQINQCESLRELLAEKERVIQEKERTIQILLGLVAAAEPSQKRDNCDK